MKDQRRETFKSVLKDAIRLLNKGIELENVMDYVKEGCDSVFEMKQIVSDTYPKGTYLVVDASCVGGNPGLVEYRGIIMPDYYELFHVGTFRATNNIGEYLALVHGLAEVYRQGLNIPVYSDSATAISWVRKKECKTRWDKYPEIAECRSMVVRATKWLNTHTFAMPLKWQTRDWGEIPADYGRK